MAYILKSCANVSPPTGGPKDLKAPKILSTIPKQYQTKYRNNKVIIEFDEDIDASKLKDKILISPYSNNEFEIETGKRKLTLAFKKSLHQYQNPKTYSFDFQNGLKDIHEGNEIKSFRLVFSTGDEIDSLRVNGTVLDALRCDSTPNVLVGLYIVNDTLNILKQKPEYISYTNSKGQFDIQNIKQGKYLIYSFTDKNKNLIYDANERLGFIYDTLKLDSSKYQNILLRQSINDKKKPNASAVKNGTEIIIPFNEGLLNYSITGSQKLYHDISTNGKEITIFKTDYCEDTLDIEIFAKDSSYNDTTFQMKIVQNSPNKFIRNKDIIKQIEPSNGSSFEDSLIIKIIAHQPILKEKDSLIILNQDSAVFKKLYLIKDFKSNNSNTCFTYTYKPKINVKKFVEVIIKSKKINSVLGDTNGYYKLKYTPLKKEEKPTETEDTYTKININSIKNNLIVELLNEKYEPIKKEYYKKNLIYKNLAPGKYSFRVIEDMNMDKRWNGGDYLKQMQPEPVKLFRQILDIKKNWEIEDLELVY
jgi:hypothetical protein